MTTETETVADVLAEITRLSAWQTTFHALAVDDYAQRIEAAHAREVGELNAQVHAVRALCEAWNEEAKAEGYGGGNTRALLILDAIDAAMPTPTREVIR